MGCKCETVRVSTQFPFDSQLVGGLETEEGVFGSHGRVFWKILVVIFLSISKSVRKSS